MKKIFSLLLALALVLSLAACGGGNQNAGGNNNGGNNQQQSDTNGGNSQKDPAGNSGGGQTPGDNDGDSDDSQTPGDGGGEGANPGGAIIPKPDGGGDGSGGEQNPGEGETKPPAVELNYTDITLRKEGETLRLQPQGLTGAYAGEYTSKDEAVATVDANGTVTAVAPGTTTVTIHVEHESGQYDFTCIVRCKWEKAPESQEKPDPRPPAAGAPSVSDFFATLSQSYDGVSSLAAVEGEVLEAKYPGLASAAGVEQVLVMEPVISMSSVAVALVKLSDSASASDVQAVKAILQGRIDQQAAGGAYYPAAMEIWGQGKVVSTGKYVGMFVHSSAQSMADLFASTYG